MYKTIRIILKFQMLCIRVIKSYALTQYCLMKTKVLIEFHHHEPRINRRQQGHILSNGREH